jgi:hypothetical protein
VKNSSQSSPSKLLVVVAGPPIRATARQVICDLANLGEVLSRRPQAAAISAAALAKRRAGARSARGPKTPPNDPDFQEFRLNP